MANITEEIFYKKEFNDGQEVIVTSTMIIANIKKNVPEGGIHGLLKTPAGLFKKTYALTQLESVYIDKESSEKIFMSQIRKSYKISFLSIILIAVLSAFLPDHISSSNDRFQRAIIALIVGLTLVMIAGIYSTHYRFFRATKRWGVFVSVSGKNFRVYSSNNYSDIEEIAQGINNALANRG